MRSDNRRTFLLFTLVGALAGSAIAESMPADSPDLPGVRAPWGFPNHPSRSPKSTALRPALPWRDVDDAPLPFSTEAEVLIFLENAKIVASKRLVEGIAGTRKLTLERDGVRVHAAFRTVDEGELAGAAARRAEFALFRDFYGFEVAAYRLDRMLGLGLVPPTVLRVVGGERGSVQLWIEGASTAAMALDQGLNRPPRGAYREQLRMRVFDSLIYNFDRHYNNFLYDPEGRLWLIDHTRSFKRLPFVPDRDRIAACDRELYLALRNLDFDSLRRELGDVLEHFEIKTLYRRRTLLLEHLERLAVERGEAIVLLDPPPAARIIG
jgi:hypothetical protein